MCLGIYVCVCVFVLESAGSLNQGSGRKIAAGHAGPGLSAGSPKTPLMYLSIDSDFWDSTTAFVQEILLWYAPYVILEDKYVFLYREKDKKNHGASRQYYC